MRPISRRLFLAGSAAVVLAACSSDDGETESGTSPTEPSSPPTDAPSTTVAPTTTAAPTTTTEPVVQLVDAPAADLAGDPFTLGVASGDPDATSVILWTRLAPEPLAGGGMPDSDVDVAWDVASDDAFTDLVYSEIVTAPAQYAHSVHVIAELEPGWWYYRFRVGEFTSPVARTRTAPSQDEESVEPVRFASASCQNYQSAFYTAHDDIADQEPDFVAFLGDYIYEGGNATPGEGGAVRSHGTDEPTDLVAYRDRYGLYKSDASLQRAHAACPWYVIWDDHEVENNYAGTVPQDEAGAAGFVARRQQAYQAWWEHMPVRLDPPPAEGEYKIYRTFTWGSLLDLALLDGRQYRTDQACGDVTLNLEPPCPETFDEDRTMIGEEQEAWLLEHLDEVKSTWSVIVQQTVFGDVSLGGAVLNYDQWDGYPANRNRVIDGLDPERSTVVLTGDIHFAGVGIIRSGARGEGTPVAAEFVCTSIASDGNIDNSFLDIVTSIPDVVGAELTHRGYILHTVDAKTWTADYRIVEDAKKENTPVTTFATYTVEHGTNIPVVA